MDVPAIPSLPLVKRCYAQSTALPDLSMQHFKQATTDDNRHAPHFGVSLTHICLEHLIK